MNKVDKQVSFLSAFHTEAKLKIEININRGGGSHNEAYIVQDKARAVFTVYTDYAERLHNKSIGLDGIRSDGTVLQKGDLG